MKQKIKLFHYLTGNPRKSSVHFRSDKDVKSPMVTELHLAKSVYAELGCPRKIEIELTIKACA